MKKLLLIPLLFLGGCGEEMYREQATLIKAKLPPGCEFQYVGRYGSIEVAMVHCQKQDTVTTSTRRSSGKSSYENSTAVIEE